MTPPPAHRYKNHRFPPEIIAHAVWLYHRFSLSFREVEELLAERGITVSYETVRQWCLKFVQVFAKKLRHRRGRPGDTWYLDEIFITMGGEQWIRMGRRSIFSCRNGVIPERRSASFASC